MNIFIEFDDLTALGSGLLATGETPVETAIAAMKGLSVNEMAFAPAVGKLRVCAVVGGLLKIAAEIWDRVAVSKCVEAVYKGITLVGLPSGNELKIDRAALTDTPTALNKGMNATRALPLHLNGVIKMSLTTMRRSIDDRPNPYERIAIGGGDRDADSRAIALIKYNRSPLAGIVKEASDRQFFEWLQARARAGR